jgi:hypothetical protein
VHGRSLISSYQVLSLASLTTLAMLVSLAPAVSLVALSVWLAKLGQQTW